MYKWHGIVIVASTSGVINREDIVDISSYMPVDGATEGTPSTTSNDDVDIIWSWVGGQTVGTREGMISATLAVPVNPRFDNRLENVRFSLSDVQTLADSLEFKLERINEVLPYTVDYNANEMTELPYQLTVLFNQLAGETLLGVHQERSHIVVVLLYVWG